MSATDGITVDGQDGANVLCSAADNARTVSRDNLELIDDQS